MEQSNRTKNEIMEDICPSGSVSGEDWLELAATLEKRTVDRLFSIQNHQNWKTKKPKQIAREKAYQTVYDEYDGGDIDRNEYIRKIVKMSRKHEEEDIGNGRRALRQLLENSDSDSESES